MPDVSAPITQEIAGYCTLCRSRCGTLNSVQNGRLVAVAPRPDHPTGRGLCAKGRAAPELVHSASRLQRPLRRTRPKGDSDPGWVEIGWDEALDEVAQRLGAVRAAHGAEAVAFAVTSPSATPISDSIDWIERFIRLFGSPNLCYATEICNWHKDYAHAFTFGCGIPTPDYANAELILLWGHNPAQAWLAQAGEIGEARQRGAKLVVVDPRLSQHAREADHWLRVRPGADAALALGLLHLVIEDGGYDEAFLRNWTNAPFLVRSDSGRFLRAGDLGLAGDAGHCVVFHEGEGRPLPYDPAVSAEGFGSDRFALRGSFLLNGIECRPAFDLLAEAAAPYTPARTAALTWVPEQEIRAVAAALKGARKVAYYGWSGIGQHSNATQTDRALAVLYALTGSWDAPGGNVVLNRQPVNRVSDYRAQLPEEQQRKALGLAERPLGPPAQGWITAKDLYRAVVEGEPYPVKALMVFGSNFLVSQGETKAAEAALRKLEFHVHCDLFETPTARFADILLPVGTPWEREALKVGFDLNAAAEELIQLRLAMVPPQGEARSDIRIVFDLAARLGLSGAFFNGDLEAGWNHVLAPLGLTVAELRRHPEGLRRPLGQGYRKYAEDTGTGSRGFATETRRVELYSEKLLRHEQSPLPGFHEPVETPEFGYLLTSAKSGYFCHSQHRSLASLRRRAPEPSVSLGEAIARERSIQDGDWVEIRSRAGRARFRAKLDASLHPKVAVADYGWWQACPDLGLPGYDPLSEQGSNYNALISAEASDPVSGSVPHRSFACDLRRLPAEVTQGWPGFRAFQVVERQEESENVVSFLLRARDGGALPAFRPGQHLTLQAGDGGIARSYSLCGSPEEARQGLYRVAVKHVVGDAGEGRLSGFLTRDLTVGAEVQLQAPSGSFLLPMTSAFPVVLIAAGIGITPFLGYLESLVGRADAPRVTLYYGNRSGAQHALKARLAELAAALPTLTLINHYSRPTTADRAAGSFDREGRITAEVIDEASIAARARFYLCGPPDLLRDLSAGLTARGVPPFEIFREVFRSPPDLGALPDGLTFKVRFARSNREATWTPAAGPLLDFAETLGLRPPSGCRVGQCESCAVPLLKGDVHYLQPPEYLEPDLCLTCQAVPASDLELDA